MPGMTERLLGPISRAKGRASARPSQGARGPIKIEKHRDERPLIGSKTTNTLILLDFAGH